MENLTMQEVKRLQSNSKCFDKVIIASDASLMLNLSKRQIFRLKKAVKARDPAGVIHGNRGREPTNKIINDILDRALKLFLENFDFNINHH